MSTSAYRLNKISQAEHTAARLREMAKELLAQAAALEAAVRKPSKKRSTELVSMEVVCSLARK